MTSRYAVMGNPIAHSKSPAIHAAFAAQTGQDIDYQAQLVAEDVFKAAVRKFFADGGAGLNITLPFKHEAWALADTRSPAAEHAGAVNTLSHLPDGKLLGDNTDGIGLVNDLQDNLQLDLAGKRIVLLGAGGAAKGVVQPLLAAAPAELLIVNRTASRAADLVRRTQDLGPVRGGSFDLLGHAQADLLINATSSSIAGALPPLPDDILLADGLAYDMMYGTEPTLFMRWATERQRRCSDGLGMLVEQAAEAFRIWRGTRPDGQAVLAAMRSGRFV